MKNSIINYSSTISSLQHPIVKHMAKLRLNRSYRYECQTVIMEGTKIIKEISEHHHIKTLICGPDFPIEQLQTMNLQGTNLISGTQLIIDKISGMVNSEGIIAEVSMPSEITLEKMKELDFVLVLDGIQDPGNMGTILRTALALGWNGCFILHHSTDPFNEKALRAARGATFKMPIAFVDWDTIQMSLNQNQWQLLMADTQGVSISNLQPPKKCLLVLGNEAHGPSPEARKLCQAVTIPMNGNMESLNVAIAAGILLYLLKMPVTSS